MSRSLEESVHNRVDDLLARASGHYRRKMPRVEIRFDLKGTAAGQARMESGAAPVIRFNRELMNTNVDGFFERTIPHEVAHVVAYSLYRNIRPHGDEWKGIMSLFGADPSRCHSYDISLTRQRRLQRFGYRCNCQSHQLTSIRHNRILRGAHYICKSCKQPLVPDR
ncbi:MAG: SprT-like domain-containing protein [Sedimenticola sp.]